MILVTVFLIKKSVDFSYSVSIYLFLLYNYLSPISMSMSLIYPFIFILYVCVGVRARTFVIWFGFIAIIIGYFWFGFIAIIVGYLMPNPLYTYTHTHTHIYMYIYIYIYILSSTYRLFRSIRTLVWVDTEDARSRDRNPSNFTLELVSNHSANKCTTLAKGIFKVLCSNSSGSVRLFTFLYPIGNQSAQFFRRALHYASGIQKFLRKNAQPPWGSVKCTYKSYIYIYIWFVSIFCL